MSSWYVFTIVTTASTDVLKVSIKQSALSVGHFELWQKKSIMLTSVQFFAIILGSVSLPLFLAFLILTCTVTRKLQNIKKRLTKLERWKERNATEEVPQNPAISHNYQDSLVTSASTLYATPKPTGSPSKKLETKTDKSDQVASGSVSTRRGSPAYANMPTIMAPEQPQGTLSAASSQLSMDDYRTEALTRPIVRGMEASGPDYINVVISNHDASSPPDIDTAKNISYSVVAL